MAFQATHLQFAYQIKDVLNINDLDRYYSAVLYPDSRYITKIDRDLTHGKSRMDLNQITKLQDDFQKGWQVHLWYDKLGLPKLFNIATGLPYKEGGMEKMNYWIPVTGAKVVEDLYWWQNNNWSKILQYLKFQKQPNDEDQEILIKWYQYFIDFFQAKPDLNKYQIQAHFMGIDKHKTKQIIAYANKLNIDNPKKQSLQQVMEKVKAEFINLIY
ncbi:MAG: hypothetical protein GF365_04895 [Candidatus Buchananbacteria bacterium]|nr:hypothetical protein [Candidatus Buchananbacteria bacterium]